MKGIRLDSLTVSAEGHFNFSRLFGISEEPALETVNIIMTVASDASKQALDEIDSLARQRCPAAFTLTHTVPLNVEIHKVE
jgi:uncharacterized OsmC-like protein